MSQLNLEDGRKAAPRKHSINLFNKQNNKLLITTMFNNNYLTLYIFYNYSKFKNG